MKTMKQRKTYKREAKVKRDLTKKKFVDKTGGVEYFGYYGCLCDQGTCIVFCG